MTCIYCSSDTKVVNSRAQARTNGVWRRRECKNCHTVFTSVEQADLAYSIRIKTSEKALEPFSRPKLQISLYECLKHLDSPEATSDELTNTVILHLLARKRPIFYKTELVEVATEVLTHFNDLAGRQYAAFHRR